MRKLTYFVACSIDGFIGDPKGDGSATYSYVTGEYLEYLKAEYPETIAAHAWPVLGIEPGTPARHYDTVLQGLNSYRVGLDVGITSPYAHLRELVATRSLTESPDPHVELIAEDLVGRVRELKAEDGPLDIWLCGGSTIAGELIDEIDELVIKTYPQVFGAGMPMFGADFSPRDFTLGDVRSFDNGVLVRTYTRKR
ncbi:dihydrofolate reductase family protein [Streptomyces sp. NPDC126499]|uniref:dihydrofolate reductase family protein n=1 Tax=Streptomyces sp. NPDC126499 TaxID=3155314 RepID=UPI00331EF383